jgi:coenzyme F420-0:L-glutamate ligase
MNIIPVKTEIFREGESLISFIKKHIPKLTEGCILAVTSKIVALAEHRTATVKNEKEKIAWIKKESQWAIRTKYTWLTVRDGMVMASAGIDESNGNGKLILLPKNSFQAAAFIQKQLQKSYKMRRLGVVITDSRLLPLRNGTVGVALGYAGFKGIKDYRGKPDLFGRHFHFQKTDVADSIATAAVLTMGEGCERRPLAVITGAPIEFTNRVRRKELEIDIKEDIYRPLFERK